MDARIYLKVSIVNLAFLLAGLVLGIWISGFKARAQEKPQNVEDVSPAISAGSAAFGTLLAGRLAADDISTHGVSLLKLHEGTLGLLRRKGLMNQHDFDGIEEGAKVPILRMKQPEPPKPAVEEKKK